MVTRAQAERRIHRGFYIHLGVYVSVVSGLTAMNLSRHPEKPWSLWVAAGWGMGVALHGSLVYLLPHQYHEQIIDRTIARMERRHARRVQRSAKHAR